MEKSDELSGGFTSHFGLYVRAMTQAGADTGPITRLVQRVAAGTALPEALDGIDAPAAAAAFVRSSWETIHSGHDHEVAGAFAFGREDLIPAMFTQVLNGGCDLPLFREYLTRHIDVDEHAPTAMQMLVELCPVSHRRR